VQKLRKPIILVLLLAFCSSLLGPAPVMAQTVYLPQPGTLVGLSQHVACPVLRGVKVDPNNPLRLEFIIDTPNNTAVSKEEFDRLIGYFMAVLTIPEKDFWVNLSPYEQERIINPVVEQTSFGRELLTQDYLLKQLAASLTHPESQTGKNYWNEINRVGANNHSPVDNFNKVWIMPEKAEIYENGNVAYLTQASLKVLTEEDYLAQSQPGITTPHNNSARNDALESFKNNILPAIDQDVNNGENFTQLRQMYCSFLLASWFKSRLKESLYKYYINQNKVQGIELKDKNIKEKIYNQYVEAFKKGVYNYVKKEIVGANNHSPVKKITKRQYFSGGVVLEQGAVGASGSTTIITTDRAAVTLPAAYSRPVVVGDVDVLPGGKGSGSGASKKAGTDWEPVTDAEKDHILDLYKRGIGGVHRYELFPHSQRLEVGYIVIDDEMSPNKRGCHVTAENGTRIIALRGGLDHETGMYVVEHEDSEIRVDFANKRGVQRVATNANIPYERALHMIVSAGERAAWISGKKDGLMPVDEEDLQSYDLETLRNIINDQRGLQYGLIVDYFNGDSHVIGNSLSYEARFKARAWKLLEKKSATAGKDSGSSLTDTDTNDRRLDEPTRQAIVALETKWKQQIRSGLRIREEKRRLKISADTDVNQTVYVLEVDPEKENMPAQMIAHSFRMNVGKYGGEIKVVVRPAMPARQGRLPERYQPYLKTLVKYFDGTVEGWEAKIIADIDLHERYELLLRDHTLAFHAQQLWHYDGDLTPFQYLQLVMHENDAQWQARMHGENRVEHEAKILREFGKINGTRRILEDNRQSYGSVKAAGTKADYEAVSGAGKVAGTPYSPINEAKLAELIAGDPAIFDSESFMSLFPLERRNIDVSNFRKALDLLKERGHRVPLLKVVMDNVGFVPENELSRWVSPHAGFIGGEPFIVLRQGLSAEEIAWALAHDTSEYARYKQFATLYQSIARDYKISVERVAHIDQSADDVIMWLVAREGGLMPVHEAMLSGKIGNAQYYRGILEDGREMQEGILARLGYGSVSMGQYKEYQDRFKARADRLGGIALETNIILKSGSKAIEIKVTPQQVEMMKNSPRVGYKVVTVGEQHSLKEVLSL